MVGPAQLFWFVGVVTVNAYLMMHNSALVGVGIDMANDISRSTVGGRREYSQIAARQKSKLKDPTPLSRDPTFPFTLST